MALVQEQRAPAHLAPSGGADGVVQEVLARRAHDDGALLPILHDIQDRLGFVPSAAVPEIAEALNLSRAEVHGVVTYYHHFRDQPAGRHVVQICRAEACQSMGADALMAHAELRLGCHSHATTADGEFTLEPVYCLGLCASAPALTLDGEVHARVTPKTFDALIEEARSEA
ncbi:formate dehydrogenase subunit gamma [Variovorax dokdonensis]|uniref:Formate dehydrogenase subunit gamma n=1 Tax=Variovorax dokdonensis TaxID=344883 RepID=A0ABT7N533_9BURK|nr:formate dehydrogenase subunit gamma [Variovorax dokdonensis]MDM0043028.1 formate dehydrogenase subunit gamma [Variovorax dokdonensis]